ncbi:hypothetical protein AB833_26140 [Chromatiales bacterium (ex Bugula neritina AB1)]|nr:hypothetical protein AB833_26140 [Chromatiales bacterium (ex Bugula neritina AB1)]
MSIEKAGSGIPPASVSEAAADKKGRKAGKGYDTSKDGLKVGDTAGAKPRLTLKGGRSKDTSEQSQANAGRAGTEESPDMVYDQLMVLLQQALHEVPATLAAKEKRRR